MDRLEADHDNFRTALSFCRKTERIDEGLRLVAAFGWFWVVRCHLAEGSGWCATFINASDGVSKLRMRALMQGSWFAHMMMRLGVRATYTDEALRLALELGDKTYECWALLMKSRVAGRRMGGYVVRELAEQALAAAYVADDEACLRWSYHSLGIMSQLVGDFTQSITELQHAEALHRQAGDVHWLLWTVLSLGNTLLRAEDLSGAMGKYREGLGLAYELPSLSGMEQGLAGFARLASARGHYGRAMFLAGAAERLHERTGSNLSTTDPQYQETLEAIRNNLGEAQCESMRSRGRSMTLEEAIAFALSEEQAPSSVAEAPFYPLTPRETEIARLVAQGLTNRQIADQLTISVQTAERHLSNILGKLSFSSRSQVAVWITERSATQN